MQRIVKTINALKIAVILLLFIGLSLPEGSAQRLEITPFGGYMFGGSIRGYEGDFKIMDKGHFGGALGYSVFDDLQIEFLYLRQESEARLRTFGVLGFEDLFNMVTEYYQLGVVKEIQGDNIRPFGSLSLGASGFKPQDDAYDSRSFFSATLGLGVKAFFNERVGLRLQGRLLVPMYFGGGSLWCSTGGCAIGVGTYSPILQGDLSAGLIIVIE